MPTSVPREWDELAEPWRVSLELAWEAYLARTVPVGAVVVDGAGRIVARGRNRIFEARDAALAGTRLAHAEVVALSALPAGPRYRDHTVYSALEPCLLCVGAALISDVGSIRYLTTDPIGGACRGQLDVPAWHSRPVAVEGPLGGWPGDLSAALSLAFWLGQPDHDSVLARWTDGPVDAAARIAALDQLPPKLDDALPRLLDCLT